MSIFKTYDIRGVYGENLTELEAYKIGYYVIKYFNLNEFKVARDCRNSGDSLTKFFVKGVLDAGAKVHFLGLSSTPNFYFSLFDGVNSGVMITASHNTKEYNGFKFIIEGVSFDGRNGLFDLGNLVEGDDDGLNEKYENFFDEISNVSLDNFLYDNSIVLNSTLKDYSLFLKEKFDEILGVDGLKKLNGLKIGVDFSSGVSSLVFVELKKLLNLNFIYYDEICDGDFPSHSPDPNTAGDFLKKQKENLDLIAAFDGDGDRISFYDESKNLVMIDYVIADYIDYFSKDGKNFVCDLRVSRIIKKLGEDRKFNVDFIKVGRAFYKDHMDENNCGFGAELSGHLFFESFKNFDNPDLALIYMLKIYLGKLEKNNNLKFSEMFDEYKVYFKIHETNFKVKDADVVFDKLKGEFSENLVLELDGLSFDFGDWWFNIRKSNTEPVVRVNLEAKNEEIALEKMNFLKGFIL